MKSVRVPAGDYGELLMAAPDSRIIKKRYRTLMTKEPTTIEWLGSFNKNDVFVDIGANIGLYSLFAAKFRGCSVYGFEPQALNYAQLCRNIVLNGLTDDVTAYCLAMSDKISVSTLYTSEFSAGQSHNDFGSDRATSMKDKSAEWMRRKFPNRIKQGCAGFPLDELVNQGWVPDPNHIKIDVDGFEHKVVQGMVNLISSSEHLLSVLIEIDHRIPEHKALIKFMREFGWDYDKNQMKRSLPTSDVEFNYIFRPEHEISK